jgi:glutaconate CoA-transferase subunit A
VADILFARAARKVIATVEAIIPTGELANLGVSIPYFYVTALAEAPGGAHPSACYPFYAYDRRHTAGYYRLANQGAEAFREGYLKPYIHDCPSHQTYLEAIGGRAALDRLATWQNGPEAWSALYA